MVEEPEECLERVRALGSGVGHRFRLEPRRGRARSHAAFFPRRDRTPGISARCNRRRHL
jgi:hypothetical protein